jgi:hypothetical protein
MFQKKGLQKARQKNFDKNFISMNIRQKQPSGYPADGKNPLPAMILCLLEMYAMTGCSQTLQKTRVLQMSNPAIYSY